MVLAVIRALSCALLACGPATAQAQDLHATLAETFAPMAHVDTLPDTLSCTALYRSLALVLGPDSDMAAEFQSREGYMASVAGLLWVSQSGAADQTPDDVFTILLPLINTATEHYLAHMNTVAAQTDAPFDDVIFSQTDFCNAIFETLQNVAE